MYFAFGDRLGNTARPMAGLANAGGILGPGGLHGNRLRQLKLVRVMENRSDEGSEDDLDFKRLSIAVWAPHIQSSLVGRK
jgi:hypothetical protein